MPTIYETTAISMTRIAIPARIAKVDLADNRTGTTKKVIPTMIAARTTSANVFEGG